MFEQVVCSELEQVFGDMVYPIIGGKLPCITYKAAPVSCGALNESQIEIRVISKNYDEALEMAEKVKEIFSADSNKDFKSNGSVVFRGALSGGGILFNDEYGAYENTLFFILKWREKDVKR